MWKQIYAAPSMQPEYGLIQHWSSVYKISSLESFYLEAIIPLISITLKSSFYEAAQVSDSQSLHVIFQPLLC